MSSVNERKLIGGPLNLRSYECVKFMGGTRYYYAYHWDAKRAKYICIDDCHTNYALDPAFIIRPQTLIDFAWTPAERLAQQAIDRAALAPVPEPQ